MPGVLRSHAELTGLFGGLDVAEPGVVSWPCWRLDFSVFGQPPELPHFGGMGRSVTRRQRARYMR